MSASDTAVSICILVKSSAISNKSGVWNDAATVWPTSTLREMTVPSTGDTIVAYPRFVTARSYVDWARLTDCSACSYWVWDCSISARAMKPSSYRVLLRSYSLFAKLRWEIALSKDARDSSTDACKTDGSMVSKMSPFLTLVLKSTYRLSIVPDTWDPTLTVFTGWISPVAVTTWRKSPRVIFNVINSPGFFDVPPNINHAPIAMAASNKIHHFLRHNHPNTRRVNDFFGCATVGVLVFFIFNILV